MVTDLATGFGRRVRNFCRERLHRQIFPECVIADDSDAIRRFSTTADGEYVAVGRVGTLTGRGGDLIIVDDPIRDDADARNPDFLKKLDDWYQETLYSRLEPGGAIVLVTTRWNTEDLAGWLLKEHASDAWKVISLPAIAELNDPLGRPEGAPLWPERFPLRELAHRREAVGTYAWLAQYQQRPAAVSGNIFKKEWWRSYSAPPTCRRVIFSLDTAFKAKESADYSVIEVWGETENGYCLLHVWRERVEFPVLKATIMACAQLWKHNAVLVEDAASGQSLIQALQSETRLPILPVKPLGDKVARASAVSPLVESGRVLLPAAAGWLADFLDEVSAFPSAPHDDQVDCMSQALSYLHNHSWSALDSEEWQKIGRQQLEFFARQRRIKAHVQGEMFNNVNDMLEYEDGVGASGHRHTLPPASRTRRWGGF